MPDIANILRLPNQKVNRWTNNYWDNRFGKKYDNRYSWKVENSKAVNFLTLVEFYTFIQLRDSGVTATKALKAHEELAELENTSYPFAKKNIIDNICTDGKRIYFSYNGNILSLDGSRQFNLDFIKYFFKKLDFGENDLAKRLWPLGKDRNIVCDPARRFGQPVIDGTNILAATICNLYKSGEKEEFIASLYDLTVPQINDALEYCGKKN